jgi:hypothetical protein
MKLQLSLLLLLLSLLALLSLLLALGGDRLLVFNTGLGQRTISVLAHDLLDDANGDGSAHITDGETTERGVDGEGFDAHRLRRLHLDDAGLAGLDELGIVFDLLTVTLVDLDKELVESASDVGSVTVEDRRVTGHDLVGVIKDDDLSIEAGGRKRRIVLGVTANVTTLDVLNGNVLDVESDVVTREGGFHGFVVHFDGLDFGSHVDRGEGDDHTRLDRTSLNTADRDSADTTDLVHILKRKTERLVDRAGRRLDGIEGFDEDRALVPLHVGGTLKHVITVPSGDRDERDVLDLVSGLTEKVGHFILDFIVTLLVEVDGFVVHLVDAADHLLDTKSEGQKGVLAGLTSLGETSFELTDTRGDHEDGNIGLGSTSDHVLDEVTVSRGINDGEVELLGLKLPEGNINGDTSFTLGLELIQNPGVLERSLSHLFGLLLELFDLTLVDTTTLVDQVSGSGRFTSIDVSDNNKVNVKFFFTHG